MTVGPAPQDHALLEPFGPKLMRVARAMSACSSSLTGAGFVLAAMERARCTARAVGSERIAYWVIRDLIFLLLFITSVRARHLSQRGRHQWRLSGRALLFQRGRIVDL